MRNLEPHPFVPRKNISGKRFGRLTVVRPDYRTGCTSFWLCKCDCGNETIVSGSDLKSGRTRSCRCLHKELLSARQKIHGMTDKHPAYNTWRGMIQRCNYPKHICYHRYGGRGITVCPEWRRFDRFWKDMGKTWYRGGTIERIDKNGNYEPSNCKWATYKEQANNSRRNKLLTVNGITKTMRNWCDELGVSYYKVRSRIRYGWTHERALFT